MNVAEATVFFGLLYLGIMFCALYGLYVLPRGWRILLYLILGAMHLCVFLFFYALTFIDVNNAFTVQTEQLFTTLAEQLSQGGFHEESLTSPSLAVGLLWSAFGILAFVGGLFAVCRKPRWWTWLPVCLGLIFSGAIFSVPQRKEIKAGIAEQNELRRHAYEVVRQKREEGVPDTLLAETITSQLKDFRGSYENRTDAKESADRILSAINALTPNPSTEPLTAPND